jgi:hypothetical protein
LELLPEEAEAIEDEVLNPYRKYREKGERYEQSLQEAMQQEYPFSLETRDELKRLQQVLGLTDEDAATIEELVIPKSLFAKLYKAIATVLEGHRNPNPPPASSAPQLELQASPAVSPQVNLNGKTYLSSSRRSSDCPQRNSQIQSLSRRGNNCGYLSCDRRNLRISQVATMAAASPERIPTAQSN